ncbi:hypothetical protein JOM56_000827 [Amanita muscaria]
MPSQDPHIEVERGRDNDTDRDRDKDREQDNEKSDRVERGSSKQRPSASQKTKDLSHVPCKFFKVGACTAGSSCPFSHNVPEPGHKEACAWFVKGNCKFGHKCALAHVLPGQSMAMDRKNKKAAQAAAATEKGAIGSKEGFKDVPGRSIPRRRDGHHNAPAVPHGAVHGAGGASQSGQGRNTPLFSGGATAPTRILRSPSTSARPPINMPLKAPISPSAPAPPLKDTDFASFASLDEMEGVMPEYPDQDRADSDSKDGGEFEQPVSDAVSSSDKVAHSSTKPPSPVPLPTSAPRPSVPLTMTDFGPIGSPPSAARLNGALATRKVPGTLSPGTSPRSNGGAAFLQQRLNQEISLSPPGGRNSQSHLPSSPFSAPGAQSIFLSSSLNTGEPVPSPGFVSGAARRDNGGVGAFSMGGIASSLNTGMALMRGYDDDFGSKGGRVARGLGVKTSTTEHTSGDDDLEEFIPSSLSDLLTPEEIRRRMSRSGHQSQAQGAPMPTSRLVNAGESLTAGTSVGHRYSRSVPAPSLLGDVKSIWADTASINQRRGTPNMPETEDITGLQVPKPVLNGGGNPVIDELGLSMSMGSSSSLTTHINAGLSPSNASAAFLPGLHHHYLKAKQQAQLALAVGPGSLATAGRQNSGTGPPKGIRTASGPLFPATNAATNPIVGNVGVHTQGGISQTYRTTPSPFDLAQHQHQYHNRPLGGLGQGGTEDPLNHISSPSTRALQAHAPGQSLPQGLAAGLSRIHALPPLPSLTSPGTSLNTDATHGLTTSGPYEEWKPAASPVPNMLGGTQATSSTTTAGDLVGTIINGPNMNMPRVSYSTVTRVAGATTGGNHTSRPTSTRPGISGGHYQPMSAQPAEDDELFAMDG